MDLNKGIHIVFDGGSKFNGTLNKGYGSFVVFYNNEQQTMTIDGKKTKQCYIEWEDSTSNESELKTCYAALSYCLDLRAKQYNRLKDVDEVVKQYPITLHGDSALVIQALTKNDYGNYNFNIKAGNLIELVENARMRAANVDVNFVQEPRGEIFKILNH